MSTQPHTNHTQPSRAARRPRSSRWGVAAALVLPAVALASACGGNERDPSASPSTSATSTTVASPVNPDGGHGAHDPGHVLDPTLRAVAQLATAGYQDVATAEADGYASSLDALGCFENPTQGGMGVHYINEHLLDAKVDIAAPEALVYELDATGAVTGLVAHEYIVPVDAWTSASPPQLFGMDFHRHATLPLWVLHTWLWKDNPAGVFADWNPAVRQCPAGVPVFGTDRPAPSTTR